MCQQSRASERASFGLLVGQAGFGENFEGHRAAQVAITRPVHLGLGPAQAFEQLVLSNVVRKLHFRLDYSRV